MLKGSAEEPTPKSMREMIQKKFLEEIIGCSNGWKVLVMDPLATRVISSALTMYDIMEHKVTLVEKLHLNRQPFPDMDVIYLTLPTVEAAQRISKDFESRSKAKYNNVHLFFLENIDNDVFGVIQSNPLLVSKVKTLKEVYLDFLSIESNVFHFDMPNSIERLYGVQADTSFPNTLGRKLAHFCISMNEHPCIRYQGSSPVSRDIATALHQTITAFKRANPEWWCYGDDRHMERERAQILIVDRSFDPLSPLMHEYTYQAMVNDLLEVEDGNIITYTTTNNRGAEVENKAILNENDVFWAEHRHDHIAKVIDAIKGNMNDIIQNNAGAKLAKASGADMDISSMAQAVKQLPDYQETTGKLGEHVSISTQCMAAFMRQALMRLSAVEQTISTGFDDDGKEVKGMKLCQLVTEALGTPMEKTLKLRLLAIYYISQKNVPGTADHIRQAFAAARLSPTDEQVIKNFERILVSSAIAAATPGSSAEEKKGGIFSSIFGFTKKQVIPPSAEGEYTDTRHVCLLKGYLEQLIAGNLALDKFPAMGPTVNTSAKAEAKSARRFAATGRFGRKDAVQYNGGRLLVFIAGGASFAELRSVYETMSKESRETILGTTHMLTPDSYLVDVGSLHVPPAAPTTGVTAQKRENMI
jgi:syntaxin-binding protein 1